MKAKGIVVLSSEQIWKRTGGETYGYPSRSFLFKKKKKKVNSGKKKQLKRLDTFTEFFLFFVAYFSDEIDRTLCG